MKKYYSILLLIIIWQLACGTEAAKNENTADNSNVTANENAQNTNGQNSNTNINQKEEPEEEEVPKFEDADEALKKGTEYFDENKNEMAIDAFKQAVELNPDLAEAHFKLGVALALEESEKEKTVETGTLETDPSPTPKKKRKSKKPEKKPSELAFENAVKTYKKFIRKNPKDAAAHFNLGRAYVKLFEDQDARKALEKAVKLNDEDTLYRTELGAVLIKLAKYPEAIKQLNKAIDLDEQNTRAEDLLEQAKAGRKRVDFGAKKKAKTLQNKK